MSIRITAPPGPVTSILKLPASKSISNRVLIIRALCNEKFKIYNLSDADDTRILDAVLNEPKEVINCGEGGTTLRFLLAYLALKGGTYKLEAGSSLTSRPLKPLLDILQQLGCSFDFHGETGKLPFTIVSAGLRKTGPVDVPGDISSQFVSALMLIGPYLENGISLRITGEVLSFPYIRMTAKVMEHFGVMVDVERDRIHVPSGKYIPANFTVEPDWSAATYWMEIAALRRGSEIFLQDLSFNTIQGDSSIVSVMKEMGVHCSETSGGMRIEGSGKVSDHKLIADLGGSPDTAPALIAAAAGLNMTADFTELKNFRMKESDRAAAFQRELYNFNVNTDFCGGSKFKVYSGSGIKPSSRVVRTYHDHRIAMALAPVSLCAGPVMIDDPEVVSKSYPGFFSDLSQAGFTIEVV
jgi:3-phosphoshikimate 1-carboxyvinyltransferase